MFAFDFCSVSQNREVSQWFFPFLLPYRLFIRVTFKTLCNNTGPKPKEKSTSLSRNFLETSDVVEVSFV